MATQGPAAPLVPLGAQRRPCVLCQGSLQPPARSIGCPCGVTVHERCAAAVAHCPGCDRSLRSPAPG